MSPKSSRCDFLKAMNSAATSGAIAMLLAGESGARTADAPASAPPYPGEIVETHLHLWNLEELRLSWIQNSSGKNREILRHDFLLGDSAEAMRGLKVTRAV